jgi:uncharacterized protein YjbI with pentapeptide repeats
VAGLADDRKIGGPLRKFFRRRAVRVVGGVALLVVVVVVLLFLVLNWYVAPTKPSERKDLILAMAQILGGTALLLGLYFTWRTLQVNREGQITDRFTHAIEQLGKTDDKGNRLFEIRLGGIYALERIARESEEDYWPIMEVLTAYVRQHAHSSRPEEGYGGDADSAAKAKSVEDSNGESETKEVSTPAPDIQAIITVLWRRTRSYGQGEPDILDLHETDLARADLPGANLTGADLSRTNLSRTNLSNADLSNANLSKANLTGADLSGANLTEARLLEADLGAASLPEANLSNTLLLGANLSDANLIGVNFREAYLTRETYSDANTRKVLVETFTVEPPSANRQMGTGGTFSVENLSDANLTGANLTRADLSEAYLSQAQLDGTIGDENTQLPPNRKPPAHWDVKTDEQTEGG